MPPDCCGFMRCRATAIIPPSGRRQAGPCYGHPAMMPEQGVPAVTKYFRVALTTAMLAGLAAPAVAQTAPATSPAGEMAPAKPDAAKAPVVKKAKPVHKHHVAAKTAPAPSK